MTSHVVASIPPQPSCLELSKRWGASALHINGCHERLVYGVPTGVLARRLPGEIAIGEGGKAQLYGISKRPITCAACSSSGDLVVGGDNDGYLHVWQRENAEKVVYHTYKLDDMRYVHLTDISLSADHRRVVAVGYDKHSKVHGCVLQADTGSRIGTIKGHCNTPNTAATGGIASACFSPVRPFDIITAGFDGRLCLHAGPPYKLVKIVSTECASLTCVRYSPEGEYVCVLGTEGYLAIFTNKLELVTDADLGTLIPLSCDWEPRADTRLLAVACNDMSIRIFKIDKDQRFINMLVNMALKDDLPRGVLWCRNNWLVSPLKSGAIYAWDINPHLLQGSFGRCIDSILPAMDEFDTEPSDLVTLPTFKSAHCLSGVPDLIFYGPRGGASVIDYDAFSQQLMIGTSLGYIMFLDAGRIIPQTYDVSQMGSDRKVKSCLTNGEYAVAVALNGSLKFFRYVQRCPKDSAAAFLQRVETCLEVIRGEPEEGEQLTRKIDVEVIHDVACLDKQPQSLMYVGGRNTIGLFCYTGNLGVYDITTGQELWNVQFNAAPLLSCGTPDGTMICIAVWADSNYHFRDLIGGSTDQVAIEVYEILDGASIDGVKFIKVIPVETDKITAMAVNAEGSMVCYSDGAYIRVREVCSNNLIVNQEWSDHCTQIRDLCWSPSGTRVLSTSTHEFFVWSVDAIHRPLKIRSKRSGYNLFGRFLFENIVITGGAEGLLDVHSLQFT